MNVSELNDRLRQYAQGRVTVEWSERCQLFYTYDSFVGPGRAVTGTLEEALARVEALPSQMARYAQDVERALSNV